MTQAVTRAKKCLDTRSRYRDVSTARPHRSTQSPTKSSPIAQDRTRELASGSSRKSLNVLNRLTRARTPSRWRRPPSTDATRPPSFFSWEASSLTRKAHGTTNRSSYGTENTLLTPTWKRTIGWSKRLTRAKCISFRLKRRKNH